MTGPVFAEDLHPGTTIELGTYLVTREEIVEFATQWDPQGFHVDEEIAAAGAFGGLIASGIHSMAIFQRLAVDAAFSQWAMIAGRSISEVQMTSPVRPGIELTGRIRIDAVEPKSPGRALVFKTCTLLAGDVPVITFQGSAYVRTRPKSEIRGPSFQMVAEVLQVGVKVERFGDLPGSRQSASCVLWK